jgi:uncharacterized protein (TIGR02145 family)
MFVYKSMLAGLVSYSLCMANISGKVTDSAGIGIAGAIVKLEKGGLLDTTESNGRFIFTIGFTSISSQINQSLPNKMSAIIHNGLLQVNVVEKTALEITTFNLNGKVLSSVAQSLGVGRHTIKMPYRGAGIYLYNLKVGNNELVLKGNVIGGLQYGNSVTAQRSSSKPLVKQSMSAAAINEVIFATKTGYLDYRVLVGNKDTSGIEIKMITSAGTATDADGNVYQTVRIGNQVWMAENLRVTKYNDGSAIPLDTSTATWNMATTPKWCFYRNTSNADSIKKFGVLYNWYVVTRANPKKIAPTGWHVPSDAEWGTLESYLIAKGYNWDGTNTGNKIAKSMAAKTDWLTNSTTGVVGCDLTKNNSSGFSALPGGYRYYSGVFSNQSDNGIWWSATERDATFAWDRYLLCDSDYLGRDGNLKSRGFSVRLVKD